MNNKKNYLNIKQMKERYLFYVMVNTSEENYRFVNSHLNIIVSYFEKKLVNYENLCDFVLYQRNKNISNSTINKRIRCLKQMYKFNRIENTDLFEFKKLKETTKTFDCLNKIQLKELNNYIENSKMSLQNKLILLLLLESGCRLNELINIKIKNINTDYNFILLERTKTSKERHILFTEKTKVKYLLPYLICCKKSQGLLFNVKKDAIRSLFERTRQKLNFYKFHPHMLRHTYATILINNNTDLEFIRITLGHTNLNTTQRYLHYDFEKMHDLYEMQYHL